MTPYRVFPQLDNHVAEHYARFGARFAKWRGLPRRTSWSGSGLAAMWALILAWQAVRLMVRGGR